MESIARNQATAAQIQRLEDAAQNPLTGKVWPQGHQNILQGRRQLPVYGRYQEILDNYHKSQVMIVSSESGSGKSTQVPQLLVYLKWAPDYLHPAAPTGCNRARQSNQYDR